MACAMAAAPVRAQDDATLKKGNETYQILVRDVSRRGTRASGDDALAAKYRGALPGLLEDRTNLTPQGIRFAVRRGMSIMPFFRKTELSDADLEAVVRISHSHPHCDTSGRCSLKQ